MLVKENTMIAEFMEVDKLENGLWDLPMYGYLTMNKGFKTEFNSKELKYHKEWNWLMPVVLKLLRLENIESFLIESNYKKLDYFDVILGDGHQDGGLSLGCKSALKATYEGVVQVISKIKTPKKN